MFKFIPARNRHRLELPFEAILTKPKGHNILQVCITLYQLSVVEMIVL